ncbi:hypothetical protein BGX38DRAFT_1236263 [Terfezia claveryi]|nr:hypothetical protein BGX38DRAFT_1243165 [Terfezia claveryi]KAF8426160.1 hypothetical protein BGX38DRAFT_1236263 [Terfezia claveryi]
MVPCLFESPLLLSRVLPFFFCPTSPGLPVGGEWVVAFVRPCLHLPSTCPSPACWGWCWVPASVICFNSMSACPFESMVHAPLLPFMWWSLNGSGEMLWTLCWSGTLFTFSLFFQYSYAVPLRGP